MGERRSGESHSLWLWAPPCWRGVGVSENRCRERATRAEPRSAVFPEPSVLLSPAFHELVPLCANACELGCLHMGPCCDLVGTCRLCVALSDLYDSFQMGLSLPWNSSTRSSWLGSLEMTHCKRNCPAAVGTGGTGMQKHCPPGSLPLSGFSMGLLLMRIIRKAEGP